MATTSPDNIWTPDSGDDYALTVDLAATADTVQAALNTLRNTTASRVGTNAQRLALTGPSLFEGLTFYTTDTNRSWFYDGAAWLTADPGTYLLTPSSVTGGTITAGKTVVTSGDTVTINGVFSSRFRRYRVVGLWKVIGGNNTANLTLCNTGTPSASGYANQILVANGATVAGSYSGSLTSLLAAGNSGESQSMDYTIFNPGHAERTMIQGQNSTDVAGLFIQGSYHTVASAYDGFRIELSTKGGGRAFSSGEIAVYGLA